MIRIALVHDWLTGMRGGEAVLEAIAELFPSAELFTLLKIPEKISPSLRKLKSHTSGLQKVPFASQKYRHFLPLMPYWIESLDVSEFDLILSSSHCVAKGIRKPPHAVHVSYIHAPMRYMWDRYLDYFGPNRASPWVRIAASCFRKSLQYWDWRASQADRIDACMTNSHFIAEQVQRLYGRTAQVVHPFTEGTEFTAKRQPGTHYLIVSAFAPYKRIDLAIEAMNDLQLPLWIVGTGPEEQRLKKKSGSTIEFLGSLPRSEVIQLYSKCKALLFPGIEDFGITPLEAMAAGAPVIAYGAGGVTESVTTKTGAFFSPQSSEALIQILQAFESKPDLFLESDCRARAAEFSKEKFQNEFVTSVRDAWIRANKNPLHLDPAIHKPIKRFP